MNRKVIYWGCFTVLGVALLVVQAIFGFALPWLTAILALCLLTALAFALIVRGLEKRRNIEVEGDYIFVSGRYENVDLRKDLRVIGSDVDLLPVMGRGEGRLFLLFSNVNLRVQPGVAVKAEILGRIGKVVTPEEEGFGFPEVTRSVGEGELLRLRVLILFSRFRLME